jgi:hypothetical protein
MIALDDRAQPKYRGRLRRCKVYYAYYNCERLPPHPMIRFGGHYLKSFGFNVGDTIEVQLDHERITITKTPDTLAPPSSEKA